MSESAQKVEKKERALLKLFSITQVSAKHEKSGFLRRVKPHSARETLAAHGHTRNERDDCVKSLMRRIVSYPAGAHHDRRTLWGGCFSFSVSVRPRAFSQTTVPIVTSNCTAIFLERKNVCRALEADHGVGSDLLFS